MKLLLTPELLNFLMQRGFKYCLSKTTSCDSRNVIVVLEPITYRPHSNLLPGMYDTYFLIDQEPVQMADGVDDTLVLVNLDQDIIKAYVASYLTPISAGCNAMGNPQVSVILSAENCVIRDRK